MVDAPTCDFSPGSESDLSPLSPGPLSANREFPTYPGAAPAGAALPLTNFLFPLQRLSRPGRFAGAWDAAWDVFVTH